MRKVICLFIAALCLPALAAVDITTATLTFTNSAGTTNGQYFRIYFGSDTNGYLYTFTNRSPVGFHLITATNTAAKSATNTYAKLSTDWNGKLTISYVSATALQIKTHGDALTITKSSGWSTLSIVTNASGGSGNVQPGSNVQAYAFTLLNGSDPKTVTDWADIGGSGGNAQTNISYAAVTNAPWTTSNYVETAAAAARIASPIKKYFETWTGWLLQTNAVPGEIPTYEPGRGDYEGSSEYLRDFLFAVESSPRYFSARTLSNHVYLFSQATNSQGAIRDALGQTTVSFDSQYDFTHLIYLQFQKSGSPEVFTNYQARASNAVRFVVVSNHLAYVSGTNHGYGFLDGAGPQGFDLMMSLWRFREHRETAEMLFASGQAVAGSNYLAEIPFITASLRSNLFNEARGLFTNSTIQVRGLNPVGSALAVLLGAVNDADSDKITAALIRGAPGGSDYPDRGIFDLGAPSQFTWDSMSVSDQSNGYQTGGFWPAFAGWTWEVIARRDPLLAQKLMGELAGGVISGQKCVTLEWWTRDHAVVGQPSYLASAGGPAMFGRDWQQSANVARLDNTNCYVGQFRGVGASTNFGRYTNIVGRLAAIIDGDSYEFWDFNPDSDGVILFGMATLSSGSRRARMDTELAISGKVFANGEVITNLNAESISTGTVRRNLAGPGKRIYGAYTLTTNDGAIIFTGTSNSVVTMPTVTGLTNEYLIGNYDAVSTLTLNAGSGIFHSSAGTAGTYLLGANESVHVKAMPTGGAPAWIWAVFAKDAAAGNPFNQSLNTGDSVAFNSVAGNGAALTSLTPENLAAGTATGLNLSWPGVGSLTNDGVDLYFGSANTNTFNLRNSSLKLNPIMAGAGPYLTLGGSGTVQQSYNAASHTNLNAGNIASGTLDAARGGAGTINGILAGNGSGTVSKASGDVSQFTAASGSGNVVGATSPTITTPTLSGNTTAGTINSTTIPSSATLTKTSDNLSVFAATTSAQVFGIVSDEQGSGYLHGTLNNADTNGSLSGQTFYGNQTNVLTTRWFGPIISTNELNSASSNLTWITGDLFAQTNRNQYVTATNGAITASGAITGGSLTVGNATVTTVGGGTVAGGNNAYTADSSGFSVSSSLGLNFSSTTSSAGTKDSWVERQAQGTIKIRTNLFVFGSVVTRDSSAYLDADQTTTSATLANINDMTITNVVAGGKYNLKMILLLSDSVAADGAVIDFNGGTATMTTFRVHVTTFDSALNLSTQLTALSGTAASTTLTGSSMVEVNGGFTVNAAGTLIPRFAQNAHTTGTLTAFAGSTIIVTKME